jgi:DNA-binding beta-propeller fold protein YncE
MFARFVLRCAPLAVAAMVLTSASVSSAPPTAPATVVRIDKITVPGKPLKAWDISWVDAPSAKYYFADRSNASIDVIDVMTNQVINQIGGFVGNTGKNDTSGPDGVIVTYSNRELWAGDGDSTMKVIDLTTNSIVATISTGGKFRVDEMTYDPKENVIIAANNADEPPFATIFSVASRSILKKIPFENATNGAEQPVYDPQTGMVYLSVPASKANPGGEIAVIDPVKMAVVATYGLSNCNPNGAALGPGNQLLAGCAVAGRSVIVDKTNGAVIGDFSNVGGSDEVWFNPGDNHYYLAESARQNLGVIDAATLTGFEVESGIGAHSVAADQSTNHIFVPINALDPACGGANGCIAVYTSVNLENKGKSRAF